MVIKNSEFDGDFESVKKVAKKFMNFCALDKR